MIRIALLLFLVIAYLLVRYLPWWGVFGVIAGVVIGGYLTVKLFGTKLLGALFSMPFKMKGRALHGARAEVHELTPIAAPEPKARALPARAEGDEDDDEEEDRPPIDARHFRLEVTISPDPSPKAEAFKAWELGELVLVPKGAKSPLSEGDDDSIRLDELEVLLDGRFQRDEGWKLAGPQRLRARIAVPKEETALEFRYYFEDFGALEVPPRI